MQNYIASLAGGTVTTTIQIKGTQTLKQALVSIINAAAGSIEVSRSVNSQIGTGQPTSDVIFRMRQSATAAQNNVVVPIKESFKILDNLYVHQTGAGNVGEITFS